MQTHATKHERSQRQWALWSRGKCHTSRLSAHAVAHVAIRSAVRGTERNTERELGRGVPVWPVLQGRCSRVEGEMCRGSAKRRRSRLFERRAGPTGTVLAAAVMAACGATSALFATGLLALSLTVWRRRTAHPSVA
jgi:hypothetical protein